MTADPRPQAGSAAWLVLDVDDTLVDTYRTGFAKCQQVARALGLEPPLEAQFGALYGRMSFEECVRRLHPEVEVSRYQASYDALASRFPPEPLCDGPSLLDAATQAGLRCGILTNGPAVKTAAKLRACGLKPSAFDFVISGDAAAVRKPHVGSFTALASHGVTPQTAWYVSDSAAEWRAAEQAGFRTVGVITGRQGSLGFLPMLLLPGSAALPAVVPGLAASAWSPRPGAPCAITFDAGFTLIQPVLEAAEVICGHLARAGSVPSLPAVRTALSAAAGMLAQPEAWWASPAAADQTLRRFYEAVLADLGCRSRTAAGEVISQFVGVANWRATHGADDLLAAVRVTGRKVGVLSNWQPSLAEVLRSAGLAHHLDAILPSTVAGAAKPSAQAFQAAAKALGTLVPCLVHVGDDVLGDVFGVLRAGGRAILARGPLGDIADSLCAT